MKTVIPNLSDAVVEKMNTTRLLSVYKLLRKMWLSELSSRDQVGVCEYSMCDDPERRLYKWNLESDMKWVKTLLAKREHVTKRKKK